MISLETIHLRVVVAETLHLQPHDDCRNQSARGPPVTAAAAADRCSRDLRTC